MALKLSLLSLLCIGLGLSTGVSAQSIPVDSEQCEERVIFEASEQAALFPGDEARTCSGYRLILRTNNNLVLHDPAGSEIWSTFTYASLDQQLSQLVVQPDGNVVLYADDIANPSAGSRIIWQSGSQGYPGAFLALESNGFLAVRDINGDIIEAAVLFEPKRSQPCPAIELRPLPGQSLKFSRGAQWINCAGYKLIFQHDGNLVLYDPGGQPKWDTNTDNLILENLFTKNQDDGSITKWTERHPIPPNWFLIQADGNVALYYEGTMVWSTETQGNPGAYLVLTPDGNLRVNDSDGSSLKDSQAYFKRSSGVHQMWTMTR